MLQCAYISNLAQFKGMQNIDISSETESNIPVTSRRNSNSQGPCTPNKTLNEEAEDTQMIIQQHLAVLLARIILAKQEQQSV